jgi:arginine transport system substrate-binding protein
MNKKIIFALSSIFVLFFLVLALNFFKKNNNQDAEVLKIGTNANLPPYETIDEKGELSGFDIDVGHALAEKMGKRAVFKEFDFDALILALNKGQIDIILAAMSITESRIKEIAMVPYHGEPLTEISFLFWKNAPKEINNLSDLKQLALKKKLSVSVQSGHFLQDFLIQEGIPIKTMTGPPEQILDIKYNKSLAAAVDSIVGKNLALEHDGLKNIILPLPKEKWDLGNGIGIKKTRTELIDKISVAVDELKTDGTLENLKQKWFKGGQ